MSRLPRFSIRQMFLATIVLAGLSAILGSAARGSIPGFAITVAAGSLLIMAMLFTAAYWPLYLLAEIVGGRSNRGEADVTDATLLNKKGIVNSSTIADDGPMRVSNDGQT